MKTAAKYALAGTVGAGVVVVAAPLIVGSVVGVSSVGPVSGGLFATAQAAGFTASGVQSFCMVGAGWKSAAAGATFGTYLFRSKDKGNNSTECDNEDSTKCNENSKYEHADKAVCECNQKNVDN